MSSGVRRDRYTSIADRPAGLGRYLVAAFLARLADEGARIAFVLVAIERSGSAASGGLIVSAFLVPHLVAAPIVGNMADRATNRARVQAIGIVVFAVALSTCGLLLVNVPLWIPILTALVGGCAGPLITGGLTSLLGHLTPPDQRDRVYALDILTYTAAGIAGPGLAAVIAQWRNAEASVWMLAGSAVVSALLVTTLPNPSQQQKAATDGIGTSLPSGRDVIPLFWRDRALASVTLATSLGSGALAILPIAIVLMGGRLWSSGWTSAMLIGSALGALVGTSLYARYPFGTARPERTCLACLVGVLLPVAGLLVTANPVTSLTLLIISGCWLGPMSSALFLVRDRAAPERAKTQVFTIAAGLKMCAGAGGAAIGGLLAGQGDHTLIVLIVLIQVVGLALGTAILAFGSPAAVGSR
jgi:predicted MFS family arabinose efflux permease